MVNNNNKNYQENKNLYYSKLFLKIIIIILIVIAIVYIMHIILLRLGYNPLGFLHSSPAAAPRVKPHPFANTARYINLKK